MRTKTTELSGRHLDVAVAKCVGLNPRWKRTWLAEKDPHWRVNPHMVDEFVVVYNDGVASSAVPKYSLDWAAAGPLVESEGISVSRRYPGIWDAVIKPWYFTSGTEGVSREHFVSGPTPLVAAMRCLVAARLGDEVEIEEMVPCLEI